MPRKSDGNANPQNAKVIQLGFNISVSGDPNSDFQIVLDDKGQGAGQSEAQVQALDAPEVEYSSKHVSKKEVEEKKKSRKEDRCKQTPGNISKPDLPEMEKQSTSNSSGSASNKPDSSTSRELSLIEDIKSTMEHFDKFSDHIKEIPRFKMCPLASSSPFTDKQNSRSESNLTNPERKVKRFSHHYDYNARKEFARVTSRQFPSDLFLRPLPGADLYRRGMIKRYDYDPLRFYGSVDSLTKPPTDQSSSLWRASSGDERFDFETAASEGTLGILKKSDNDGGGERSNSSAESVKDIKIYQNGGILIMQNFKDGLDGHVERKDVSDFSAKLIENCNRLREEIEDGFPSRKDTAVLLGNSSEESHTSGKMVQFDLIGSDYQKNKLSSLNTSTSKDESPIRPESFELTPDGLKNKGVLQVNPSSQDFLSMSTQENDSIVSNPPGLSPGASGKKLEWDSGADVGYLNLDLSKENLSTIERIVLRGLSSDGTSEKNVVFEKTGQEPSQFVLERKPSDVVVEELAQLENKLETDENNKNVRAEDMKQAPRKGKKDGDAKKSSQRRPAERKTVAVGASKGKCESTSSSHGKQSVLETNLKNGQSAPTIHIADLVDKSVSVNTLFLNDNYNGPVCVTASQETRSQSKVKSSKLSPRHRKSRKTHRIHLGESAKEKTHAEDVTTSKMGVPKRPLKNVETRTETCDLEQSRETEEIIVHPSTKVKETVAEETEPVKTQCHDQVEEKGKRDKDKRPNSSSSTKTVLQKLDVASTGETKESNGKGDGRDNVFIDELIQTSERDVESIGIQAFSSQKSGSCDVSVSGEKTSGRRCGAVNTSCKNIQAFGLNWSLPKQLAHPKETATKREVQNTKSTQFFGGPVNSLPNYHCNLVTKPVETCGRMLKVLTDKRILDADITNEVNRTTKNELGEGDKRNGRDDDPPDGVNVPENKENFMASKSASVRKQGSSRRNSRASATQSPGKKQTDGRGSVEGKCRGKLKEEDSSDGGPMTIDNASCKVLTSKHLEEHGGSIDRNLIQEKYFQSQLIEIEKREMISKSTWMDVEIDRTSERKCSSVACQYSIRSEEEEEEARDAGAKCQDHADRGQKKDTAGRRQREDSDSSQNLADEEHFDTSKDTNQEVDFGTGDSFPSSTQTAHSWIPGMQNARKNKAAVGKARSFEYLPGHIYESSGNLREKLPSENDRNATSDCSSSEADSEGRQTLVLDNSNELSCESDRLKSLDESLTQLNIVVTKLKEKDDKVQKITRSLLVNLWRHNGSGDNPIDLVANSPRVETISRKDYRTKDDGTRAKRCNENRTRKTDVTDVSIACQTEDKSSVSSVEKYYEEKKALESRITADKESQIKWIEKEIYHLNILRGLLEKQTGRRKKSTNLTLSSENSVVVVDGCKNGNTVMADVPSRSATPVYGRTNTLEDQNNQRENDSVSEEESTLGEKVEVPERGLQVADNTKYGMAVSLNGNLRKVLLLPVGVKVSMKAAQLTGNCSILDAAQRSERYSAPPSPRSQRCSSGLDKPQKPNKDSVADAMTQFPSTKRQRENNPCMSVQTDFSSSRKCCYCHQKNCVCLSLSQSEKTDEYVSDARSSSKSTRRESNKKGNTESTSRKISCDSPTFADDAHTDVLSKMVQRCSDKTSRIASESTTVSYKPNSICKCANCPQNKDYAANTRAACSPSDPHRTNARGTSPSERSKALCRCSNVQVQNSTVCACHLIKLLNPRCCTPDNRTCSCKKRNQKPMENQSCQTDDIVVEKKDLVVESKLVKPTKNQEVVVPCEGKVAIDNRNEVEEKCLCCPKVSYNKQQPHSVKIGLDERCAVQKEVSVKEPSVEVKNAEPQCRCECRKKDKPKTDDHPRHYFLKIEETEMDESNTSLERRRSLEVITVTVPVKKAGKAKIYGRDVKDSGGSNKTELFGSGNTCNCCEKCIGRICKKVSRDYENRMKEECRKLQADKPNGYKKTGKSYHAKNDCDSMEDVGASVDDFSYTNGYNLTQQSSTSQECYEDSSSYGTRLRKNEISRSDTCSRNGGKSNSRGTPSDYDSHKEYRPRYVHAESKCHEREEENNRRRLPCEVKYKAERDCGGSAGSRPTKSDKYNSEYYNYNKKEFMTKSELLKEEQQKKQAHRPSLQECLASNRPDFCSSAESRRHIISERAKERVKNYGNRMECLMNLMDQCNGTREVPKGGGGGGSKWMFTTPQMREQTLKKYKQLPEVTGKVADQKKKEEYRANKLMAEIFAKKLQLQTLKGWCDSGPKEPEDSG